MSQELVPHDSWKVGQGYCSMSDFHGAAALHAVQPTERIELVAALVRHLVATDIFKGERYLPVASHCQADFMELFVDGRVIGMRRNLDLARSGVMVDASARMYESRQVDSDRSARELVAADATPPKGEWPSSALPARDAIVPVTVLPPEPVEEVGGNDLAFEVPELVEVSQPSSEGPPPPLPRKSWLYRNAFPLFGFAAVVALLVTAYLTNITYLGTLIVVPVVVAVAFQRHSYKLRMRQLAVRVIAEAEFIKRNYPSSYPRYFADATAALRSHGVGEFSAHLPTR